MLGAWNLAPFAMWPALPTSDYYGASAHRPPPQTKRSQPSRAGGWCSLVFPGVRLRVHLPAVGPLFAPDTMANTAYTSVAAGSGACPRGGRQNPGRPPDAVLPFSILQEVHAHDASNEDVCSWPWPAGLAPVRGIENSRPGTLRVGSRLVCRFASKRPPWPHRREVGDDPFGLARRDFLPGARVSLVAMAGGASPMGGIGPASGYIAGGLTSRWRVPSRRPPWPYRREVGDSPCGPTRRDFLPGARAWCA